MTPYFWKYYNDLKLARHYNDSLIRIMINEKIKKLERMIEMNTIYLQLIESVKLDIGSTCEFCPDGCKKLRPTCSQAFCNKFKWIIDRAKYYSSKLNIPWENILDGWEKERTYWYYNFYNHLNQPDIDENIKIFDTITDFNKSINGQGFRCPVCNEITQNPHKCDDCHWELFGFLDNNVSYIYIKDLLKSDKIFKPVAWEDVRNEG